MIRIAIVILLLLASFALLRMLMPASRVGARQFFLIYAGFVAGALLLYLGLSGRLPWLFGLLGAVLPFVARSVPWVLRLIGLRNLANWLRQSSRQTAAGSGQGTSTLQTRYFDMTLDHESGAMDGNIREGQFQGQLLSALSLDELQRLLTEVTDDQDSLNVLQTYLRRHHEEWDGTDNDTAKAQGDLTINECYDILGLPPGADKEQVVAAHRRLMQRMHPDRGGSDWLAARINEARTKLVAHLDEG